MEHDMRVVQHLRVGVPPIVSRHDIRQHLYGAICHGNNSYLVTENEFQAPCKRP